jgi:hypothetical protein
MQRIAVQKHVAVGKGGEDEPSVGRTGQSCVIRARSGRGNTVLVNSQVRQRKGLALRELYSVDYDRPTQTGGMQRFRCQTVRS